MSERDPSGSQGASPSASSASSSPPRARRKAFLTYALVGAGVATSLVAIAARRAPAPVTVAQPVTAVAPVIQPAVPAARPRVELVFALDTTSSMSGLIEGAKRKIWSLASFVAQGQPTPDLRVGLVAYRDVGDAYVTRVFDLDDDLDRVYARLRGLRAEGGGDTPEHVARALDEAVRKMSWSDQQGVVKVIYLVGDAPPHTDYDDGYDLKKAARAAVDAGIAVHTIRCGDDSETESVWRKIASLGHGQFMTVEQNGGMAEVHTPFDDELANLHDRLSGTALGYGAGAAGVRAAVASAAAAPAEVKADRARFLVAKGKAVGGRGDLVADVASGAVTLEAVAPSALPPELAGMDKAALKANIETREMERAAITRRIDQVSRQREEHLARRPAKAARDGFDEVAKAALRKSVEKAGAGFKL
jgi:hypothetical protein